VFVDLAPGRFHPGAAEFERAWRPRVRAVVVVHLFGEPVEMAEITALCEQRGAVVIEDCAQAIGATFEDGSHVGSHGAAGTLSFFPAKNLGALGDGGAVLTDREDLATAIRQIRQHGCAIRYRHDRLGGNFRLDALQAALLSVLLGELDHWIERRRDNARWYQGCFESLAAAQPDRIALPRDADGHAWNQYVLRVTDRDKVRSYLSDRGIATAVYYPIALHHQPLLQPLCSGQALVEAERHCVEALALPVYPALRQDERAKVGEVVTDALTC
jgi:dTDP-4-amino-4,6-dideoxygalactose transaminase